MERLKKYSEEIILGFIILVGAVLRFHHLGFTSLSNDELSAITRAKYDSFSEMIQNGVMIDFHPAGVETWIYYWMNYFGDSVFTVRFPFAVAGIGAIFVLYLLASRWFNKVTALFASASLSVLQFPLLYSQLARPYSFGLLFTLASAYFWTRILFPEESETTGKKKKYWLHAGFILSMSACTHTHYFAFMLAGIIGLSGLFFLNRTNFKSYLFSGLLILMMFIPEIPVFITQMSVGGLSGWLGKPGEYFFREFISYGFNDSNFIFYLLIGILIVSFIYFRKCVKITAFHYLCLVWFLLPFFIGYYYSIYRNPILQYSTLLFGFPFLLVFIFSFIPQNAFGKKYYITAIVLFTMAGAYNTVKIKYYYWTNHFGVFKEIAERTVKWSDTYGEDNVAKVISVINPKYMEYYFEKMGHPIKMDLVKTEEEKDLAQLMALVDQSTKPYLLYGWSNIGHPEEALQIITRKYALVVERDTFFNSQITLFKRDVSAAVPKTFVSFSNGYESDHWGDEIKIRTDELSHTGRFAEKMDANKEYSVNFSKRLVEFYAFEKGMATASVWFNCKDTNMNANLVIEFTSSGKSYEWDAAELKSFNLRPGDWQQAIVSHPLPAMKGNDDLIKVYVWNSGKNTFYIDDIEVRMEK